MEKYNLDKEDAEIENHIAVRKAIKQFRILGMFAVFFAVLALASNMTSLMLMSLLLIIFSNFILIKSVSKQTLSHFNRIGKKLNEVIDKLEDG